MTTMTSRIGFGTAPFRTRTWAEYGYLWLALLVAPFGLAYMLTTIALTAGLAVTVAGLWVGGGMVAGGRGWGALHRGLLRQTLRTEIAEPPPFRRGRGFWRGLGSLLGDSTGWRALLFLFVSFPVTVIGFVVSTVFVCTALGAITYPAWYRWLPPQQAGDGSWHRGASFGDWFVDTPDRIAVGVAAGILVLYLWPWVMRLFTMLLQILGQALLGPTRGALRVAELRASRAGAVEGADARLRRIERDLHDGTQARLVAVAMQVDEAREHLADGAPELASGLLDTAHASALETLAELREIARGIHPAALDSGLAVALRTLAARAPLPVTVDIAPGVEQPRLAPAVESIAYYTVAELVTNAAKHAAANAVAVRVERANGTLRLEVRDDGRGGAVVVGDGAGERTGLAGLMARVRAIDGAFDLASPAGGPTVVTVTLPTSTRP
ncbi:sensor histidine kinase [Myceligenerans pegani]|uniref:histidine kinase n=1 Tax=Myceligenerans pegani TaxID=2776917 RepID=A0ABR9N3I6_9MICO|nr:sensor histidine kinase [Myceligenerans sp. TRM 65318]MBE1878221.1 sensor domain-containing protein [Myceligenerans sp. TRM 65318]MBE3020492.1 sensor domain-containing protein [Myceligenerans sp. TRM 65318]